METDQIIAGLEKLVEQIVDRKLPAMIGSRLTEELSRRAGADTSVFAALVASGDQQPLNTSSPEGVVAVAAVGGLKMDGVGAVASNPARVGDVGEWRSSYPPIMTAEELASLLRLEPRSVYGAFQRREIPGVRRIGGSWRIDRDTVLRWLADGQGRVTRSRR